MDVTALQRALCDAGHPVDLDGRIGPKTRAAIREALRGQAHPLTEASIAGVAGDLGLSPAHVGAVYDVESRGRGFDLVTGLPIILFEPHVFSRLTGRLFDRTHPTISYRAWGARPYPKTQVERWDQMLAAMALDPDAALSSASWGLFQIMGFNHIACGHASVWLFARAMGRSEVAQLDAFGAYLESQGLVSLLKAQNWAGFARRYNGPGYAKNAYDAKLATAFKKRGGK